MNTDSALKSAPDSCSVKEDTKGYGHEMARIIRLQNQRNELNREIDESKWRLAARQLKTRFPNADAIVVAYHWSDEIMEMVGVLDRSGNVLYDSADLDNYDETLDELLIGNAADLESVGAQAYQSAIGFVETGRLVPLDRLSRIGSAQQVRGDANDTPSSETKSRS